MESIIRGPAFVLGDHIDTDQIIPAEMLSYDPADPNERKEFGRRALSGVPDKQSGLPKGGIPFIAKGAEASAFAVVIGGQNFGCGSSREHAPLALAEAGCHCVVAEGYARIFYRNSVNGGYLLPLETTTRLVGKISTGDDVEVNLAAGMLTDQTTGQRYRLKPLGDAGAIVAAGGLFDYARQQGML
jgi:3-isopropylmalate/(R)-2-methylmalate dehydratase small subunit